MDEDDSGDNIPPANENLTVKQLAERTRIAPHTIRGWIRSDLTPVSGPTSQRESWTNKAA